MIFLRICPDSFVCLISSYIPSALHLKCHFTNDSGMLIRAQPSSFLWEEGAYRLALTGLVGKSPRAGSWTSS